MAVIRLDKIQAAYNGNIESVKFAADQTNGVFAKLNGLVVGEREVKNAIAPTDITKDEVVLLAAPEVIYDSRTSGLKNFTLKAGVAGRAYHLAKGDIITLTADLITGVPVVGQFATAANGAFKLAAKADATAVGAARVVFEVIEATTLGADGDAAYALQVISV